LVAGDWDIIGNRINDLATFPDCDVLAIIIPPRR